MFAIDEWFKDVVQRAADLTTAGESSRAVSDDRLVKFDIYPTGNFMPSIALGRRTNINHRNTVKVTLTKLLLPNTTGNIHRLVFA